MEYIIAATLICAWVTAFTLLVNALYKEIKRERHLKKMARLYEEQIKRISKDFNNNTKKI